MGVYSETMMVSLQEAEVPFADVPVFLCLY